MHCFTAQSIKEGDAKVLTSQKDEISCKQMCQSFTVFSDYQTRSYTKIYLGIERYPFKKTCDYERYAFQKQTCPFGVEEGNI